jgi:hypothetical protein
MSHFQGDGAQLPTSGYEVCIVTFFQKFSMEIEIRVTFQWENLISATSGR